MKIMKSAMSLILVSLKILYLTYPFSVELIFPKNILNAWMEKSTNTLQKLWGSENPLEIREIRCSSENLPMCCALSIYRVNGHNTLMTKFSPATVTCIYWMIISYLCYRIYLQVLFFSKMECLHTTGERYKSYCMKNCQINGLDEEVPCTDRLARLNELLVKNVLEILSTKNVLNALCTSSAKEMCEIN